MTQVFKVGALFSTLLALSTAAYAFQEQNTAPAPSAAPQAPAAGVTDAPQPVQGSRDGGTEIRIPGLGKLGVLPKMDFGLELLYGAADGRKSGDDVPAPGLAPAPDDDMSVRGTIKHNF